VRRDIAASDEAGGKLNGLYHQIFGRDVDPGGLATYRSALANGSSLAAVRLILGQSAEAQGDIDQLYHDVLGRPADGGGLTTYMAGLANGGSLSGCAAFSPIPSSRRAIWCRCSRAFWGALRGGRADWHGGPLGRQRHPAIAAECADQHRSAGGFTTILAPSGDAALTAPPGVPTLFDFTNLGFGHDTIAGFDAVRDTIKLPHALVANQAALDSDTQPDAAGTGTLITLNPSQSIELTAQSEPQSAPPTSKSSNHATRDAWRSGGSMRG